MRPHTFYEGVVPGLAPATNRQVDHGVRAVSAEALGHYDQAADSYELAAKAAQDSTAKRRYVSNAMRCRRKAQRPRRGEGEQGSEGRLS